MLTLDDSLYRELIQSSNTALCVTNSYKEIQLVNPAFLRLCGHEESEIVGKSIDTVHADRSEYFENGVYGGEYRRLQDGLSHFLLDPSDGQWEGRLLFKRRPGTRAWVRVQLSPVRDPRGEVSGFLWATENISEVLEADLEIRMEIYSAITSLAETRDNETGAHLRRIATFTKLLATALGMPGAFVDQIELFAPLHDIGKVGISDSILLAPRKLTDDEFATMQTHTTLGYQILSGRPTLEMAADIARFHHERFDGSGYPEGIAGGAIPISARITALADVYDALTSDRPYKQAWSHGDASALIVGEREKHFDPLVTDAFVARQAEFETVRQTLRDENCDEEGSDS